MARRYRKGQWVRTTTTLATFGKRTPHGTLARIVDPVGSLMANVPGWYSIACVDGNYWQVRERDIEAAPQGDRAGEPPYDATTSGEGS